MCRTKSFTGFVTSCVFGISIFSGCAVTASNAGPGSNSAAQEYVTRYPQIPANIHTIEDARKDLKEVLEKAAKKENLGAHFGIDFFFQYNLAELSLTDSGRREILEGMVADNDTDTGNFSDPSITINRLKNIAVLEDRLEISSRLVIPYADLSCWLITYNWHEVFWGDKDNVYLFIQGLYDSNPDPKKIERIANDLFFIQQQFKTCHIQLQKTVAQFDALAKEYREQAIKPGISEEQRKYVVQANMLTNQKNYMGAIELYRKAIEVNPVAYPAAYSNLALLYAQENYYERAINQMKKYLSLVPDAKDFRSAQDKIYEWELKMKK